MQEIDLVFLIFERKFLNKHDSRKIVLLKARKTQCKKEATHNTKVYNGILLFRSVAGAATIVFPLVSKINTFFVFLKRSFKVYYFVFRRSKNAIFEEYLITRKGCYFPYYSQMTKDSIIF